jgi:hypothetical protein
VTKRTGFLEPDRMDAIGCPMASVHDEGEDPHHAEAVAYAGVVTARKRVAAMKVDLVWFGALVAVVLQTAFLSPPVAIRASFAWRTHSITSSRGRLDRYLDHTATVVAIVVAIV